MREVALSKVGKGGKINAALLLLVIMTVCLTLNSHWNLHSHHGRTLDREGELVFKPVWVDGPQSLLFDSERVGRISKRRAAACQYHGYLDASGRCKCTVLYSGPNCTANTVLTIRSPGDQPGSRNTVREFNGRYHALKFLLSKNQYDWVAKEDAFFEAPEISVAKPVRGRGPSTREDFIGFLKLPLWKALPEDDLLEGKIFDRCALVGNSGVLLNRRSGGRIDNHDVVIRFNAAPTEGPFAMYVGSKTTLRFADSSNLGFHENDESVVLKGLNKNLLGNTMWLQANGLSHAHRVLVVSPDFTSYVANSITEYDPSTGMVGILFALQMCRRVVSFPYFGAFHPVQIYTGA